MIIVADAFTLQVDEGCWKNDGTPATNTNDKFYAITNPFGSQIICPYLDAKPETNQPISFNTSQFTELLHPMAIQFPSGGIGYVGYSNRIRFGGSDSTAFIGVNYSNINFMSQGNFLNKTVSQALDFDHKVYVVGTKEIFADGSYEVKLYYVATREGNVIATKEILGEIVINDYVPPEPPNPEGDPSTPQNPDDRGDYDNTHNPIPIPNIPSIDMAFGGASGFLNIWKIDQANLVKLGRDLWSTNFVDNIVKSITNPIDTVIALNIVPSIASVSAQSSTSTVKLGNFTSQASAYRVTSQFFRIDMGTFTFNKYWASALDYNPYTTIQLYLPYIGFIELSPDDVMGKTINVQYTCDIVTGQISALVLVEGGVMYAQTGNFSMNVPITGANYGEMYKACVSASVGAVTGIAGAVATGGVAGAVMGASILGSATSNAVNSSKIQYNRGGSMSMSAGYLGVQHCFVAISRPKQSLATNYNAFVGYPSNITSPLNALSGFTSVESIHLENISATQNERNELEKLLKEGVIL